MYLLTGSARTKICPFTAFRGHGRRAAAANNRTGQVIVNRLASAQEERHNKQTSKEANRTDALRAEQKNACGNKDGY